MKSKYLKRYFNESEKWLRVAGSISHFIFEKRVKEVDIVYAPRREANFGSLRDGYALQAVTYFLVARWLLWQPSSPSSDPPQVCFTVPCFSIALILDIVKFKVYMTSVYSLK